MKKVKVPGFAVPLPHESVGVLRVTTCTREKNGLPNNEM